ncbi:MAG: ATP phosphoribosyltransferase regulatory subunit, partial [Christensenellales bacterium]
LDLPYESVEKYCAFFENDGNLTLDELGANVSTLDDGVIGNLKQIIETADALTGEGSKIEFDATLVRGMSYYTGTIFEIELAEFNSSVAGGGRYDKMVGKFLGKDVCACGFSIGFERIISVITENNLIQLEGGEKMAVLLAKDLTNERKLEVIKRANVLRREGKVVSVVQMNKNVKYQKEMLASCGFTKIVDIFNDKGCL